MTRVCKEPDVKKKDTKIQQQRLQWQQLKMKFALDELHEKLYLTWTEFSGGISAGGDGVGQLSKFWGIYIS